jgi:hypothetical protein
MRIWLFNPPADEISMHALQNAGIGTIVTSGKAVDSALSKTFTTYAMVHVFQSTGQTEDLATGICGQPIQWFSSGCPNSPTIRGNFYAQMKQLLSQPIQGVFLDGARFSSPDSSTTKSSFFSCFCPRCRADMIDRGYDVKTIIRDVEAVAQMLCSSQLTRQWLKALYSPSGWMSLQAAYPGLADWLNYRVGSITDFVQELSIWAKNSFPSKKLAAFLFQPCLAYFVGQDYRRLSPHLEIVSPMIYRNYQHKPGPATINQESTTAARFVHETSGLPFAECFQDLLQIFGLEVDGDIPQGPEETVGMSITHVVGETLAAAALAGSLDKVAPIIWAGDPELRQTLAGLKEIGVQNCILFTHEAGLATHGDRFLELCNQAQLPSS